MGPSWRGRSRVPTTREAELAKLIENTFRHVNIALVNEIAMFATDLGIDVWGALDAAANQTLRFHAVRPGSRGRRSLPSLGPQLLLGT